MTLCNPWTVAYQAPLSMGFSWQDYWSGLPFPSSGNLPKPGIKQMPHVLTGEFFTTELPGKPIFIIIQHRKVKKQTKKKKTWSSSWVMFFLSSKIQNCPGNKMCLTVKIYPEWSLLSLPSLLPLLSIMLSVIFAVVSWSVSFFLCLLSCNPLQCVLKKTASLVILQCELYHVL